MPEINLTCKSCGVIFEYKYIQLNTHVKKYCPSCRNARKKDWFSEYGSIKISVPKCSICGKQVRVGANACTDCQNVVARNRNNPNRLVSKDEHEDMQNGFCWDEVNFYI